jgi:glucosamine--fructose-6-phosphate aminotransferase (isomerizing)
MCGIVAYTGERNVIDTLIDGLKRLEYRGYDSAGIAVLDKNIITTVKSVGKVQNLVDKITPAMKKELSKGKTGIAHTRWATHGVPSERNAHPHLDEKSRFAVVHNGIIENYASIKEHLVSKGHKFISETDTEVIPHLIDDCYEGDLLRAVAAALKKIEGTFGIAVISSEHPNQIVTARKGSPIVIGIGENETVIASDISAVISYTDKVIFLNDNDIALVEKDKIDLRNVDNVPVSREIAHIDWDPGSAEKGGFEHFMLKEIFEQPDALANSIRGRLDESLGTGILSGLNLSPHDLVSVNRIIIAACGTSLHAGMVGEYFFEDLADIPTEVEQAAEFRYRNPIINPGTFILAISQSGETADTLAAVREAKYKGATVAGICNVVGSTIPRETGRGVYLHAGPEIGVASTKAFTCQVAILLMMALKFGRSRRLSRQTGIELVADIRRIPDLVRKVIATAENIEKVAKKYAQAKVFSSWGEDTSIPWP